MSPAHAGVVVPAIPPRPPQLSLINSAVRPDTTTDPAVAYPDGHLLSLMPADARAELEARKGDAWVRGLAYAPESHAAAQVRDPCDFTSVDLPKLPAPAGLATAPHTTGGTLAAATYSYQVTAVNANGETTAVAPVTAVVGGAGSGSVTLTWQPTADNATYKIYGRVGGSIGLIGVAGPFDPDNPPSYLDTGTPAPGAAPPGSNTTGGPDAYFNLPIVTAVPYLINVEDFCSTWGFEERDFKGRALRLLDNATPQAIEKEFWTGTLAQAKGYPNNWLTNPASYTDLTPGTVPSVNRGLQILQDALAQCGFGGQGMIHVQPQTAPNLLSVRRVGSLLLDVFDNIIVPGVGYTGLAAGIGTPSATTAVMFATDLVMVRIERDGTVFPETFAEALDRGQAGQPNTIRFRAQRFGIAYMDAACHFGVRVTLTL